MNGKSPSASRSPRTPRMLKGNPNTPSKTPTKQLTLMEAFQRQKGNEHASIEGLEKNLETPKKLREVPSPQCCHPNNLNTLELKNVKPRNRLSLTRGKLQDETKEISSNVSSSFKSLHFSFEPESEQVYINGDTNCSSNVDLSADQSFKNCDMLQLEKPTFTTPSKKGQATKRDVTPTFVDTTPVKNTPSYSGKKRKQFVHEKICSPSTPSSRKKLVHEKVSSPSTPSPRTLKQTKLFPQSSPFKHILNSNTNSSTETRDNSKIDVAFESPSRAPTNCSSKTLNMPTESQIQNIKSRTDINHNIQCSEKSSKRFNDHVTSEDNSSRTKRLKLSLKSSRVVTRKPVTKVGVFCLTDSDESDVEIVPNEPSNCNSPPTISLIDSDDISDVEKRLKEPSKDNSPTTTKLYRRNRFIKKIPSIFADLKNSFAPSSCHKKLKPASSNKSELPELKDFGDQESSNEADNQVVTSSTSFEDQSQESQQFAYYWSNFLEIVRAVLDIPEDRKLFNGDEIKTVRKYYTLSENAQMLYARLFVRHHEWLSKISYPEISDDLQPALQELVTVEYLDGESQLDDLETILHLLQAAKVKELCKKFNLKRETNKASCIKALLDNCSKQRPLFNSISFSQDRNSIILKSAKEMLSNCYRVTCKPRNIFRRIMMLYSLSDTCWNGNDNEYQPVQLTTLMHVNMGKLIFPSYSIKRHATIFKNRDDLLKYEEAYTLENDIFSSMEKKDFTKAKILCDNALTLYRDLMKNGATVEHETGLPDFLRRFTSGYSLTRCLNYRIDVLQKLNCHGEACTQLEELLAQTSYCQNNRGYWIDRYALNVHQHLGQPLKALEIIIAGQGDPRVTDNYLLSLSKRAQRIRRIKNIDLKLFGNIKSFQVSKVPEISLNGQKMDGVLGVKSVFLYEKYDFDTNDVDVTVCSVEQFALSSHYNQFYPKGVHAEGSILITLFGLLFWDIIYMDGIVDAFRGPHQAFPLDLLSQTFVSNRKSEIENRFLFLNSSPIEIINNMVEKHWKDNCGLTSLVKWDLFTCEDAMSLVSCIGNFRLTKICERFVGNFRHYCSGVPDLTVWHPITKEWKMVEVKGPGDKLSDKQIIWLNFLLSIEASVEVCYVKASGGKLIKKKV